MSKENKTIIYKSTPQPRSFSSAYSEANLFMSLYKSRARALVRFVFGVAVFALCIGTIYRVWDMEFDFSNFMERLVSTDFGSFDFQSLVQDLNDWVESLPSWLDWAGEGIRVIAYLALSGSYVLGFIFKLLGLIFS